MLFVKSLLIFKMYFRLGSNWAAVLMDKQAKVLSRSASFQCLMIQCWDCKEPDCYIHNAGRWTVHYCGGTSRRSLSGLAAACFMNFNQEYSDSTFLLSREVWGQPKSSCGLGAGA